MTFLANTGKLRPIYMPSIHRQPSPLSTITATTSVTLKTTNKRTKPLAGEAKGHVRLQRVTDPRVLLVPGGLEGGRRTRSASLLNGKVDEGMKGLVLGRQRGVDERNEMTRRVMHG